MSCYVCALEYEKTTTKISLLLLHVKPTICLLNLEAISDTDDF